MRGMAGQDEFLFDVARTALLSGLKNDADTIIYRQEVVSDGLKNPAAVRQLYDLAVEAIERKRKGRYWGFLSRHPGSILYDSIEILQMFMDMLKKLRDLTAASAPGFSSRGFRGLFAMIGKELTDEYFGVIRHHLTELRFNRGVLLSSGLGQGNRGAGYVLRTLRDRKLRWLQRVLGQGPPAYTYQIPERDEAGARALSELRDRGINGVANALAQSMDHIEGFFAMLRTELAFYIGCLNLHEKLAALDVPTSFPRPMPAGRRALRFRGLSDVCLALAMGRSVVRNDAEADGKSLVIITGANQGGKTSFLRGLGLAQLMMQSGLFVAAESFAAELCADLFSHFEREEDATMKSGKLDEELGRMSGIVDALSADSIILFNESFSSTNEREGSEIARQIVQALLERRIKVYFVTHLHEFAHAFIDGGRESALFLRAERREDGTRTFKLVEGRPLETSYGEDLYREIFATSSGPATRDAAR